MSNDALIMDLSARLDPVERRSVLGDAALILAFGFVELVLFLNLGLMRPDMGQIIGSPYMIWKLGGLALLAVVGGAAAIRSFSPPVPPRRGLTITFALAGLTAIAGALLGFGQEGALLDRLAPIHGMICSLCIVALSLPMVGMMAILMRRAAPFHPARSAVMAGMASGAWGAFVFAFCCPINDPLYVVVWYALALAAITGLSRWMLPKGFRL